jgi:hypothetical protein
MGCWPCRPLQHPRWYSYYGPVRQRDAAEFIATAVADHLQAIGATVSVPIRRVIASPLPVPVALSTPPIGASDDRSLTLCFSTSLPGRVTLACRDASESFEYGVGLNLAQRFHRPVDETFVLKFDCESARDVSARILTIRLTNDGLTIADDKIVIEGAIFTISKVYRDSGGDDADAGFAEGMCLICCTEVAIVVGFPCRHCCMCRACSERFATTSNRCPVCRALVAELVECVTAEG